MEKKRENGKEKKKKDFCTKWKMNEMSYHFTVF